jgi:diguanylate cyclase
MTFGSHRKKKSVVMKLVASNDPLHRMRAEQTVAAMNTRMKLKLTATAREGLIAAMLRVAEKGGLSYGQHPFRTVPKQWTISNLIAQIAYRLKNGIKGSQPKTNASLADTNISLKQSGVFGLVIAVLISLIVGITQFGEPAELGLQMGRDALRRTTASGDIVIVEKNEATAQRFGGLPWARRYDAQLVNRLRDLGVKRIVFTNVYADPSNAYDDNALLKALGSTKGMVWLGIDGADLSNPAMRVPVAPQNKFAQVTHQANGNIWFGVLGQVEHMPSVVIINGIKYPAKAVILADTTVESDYIKLDYAIDFHSIPKIDAADVLDGKAAKNELAGKTVLVGTNSERIDPSVSIFGQGRGPSFYSYVIAAETLKRGMPKQLGYALPLIAAVIIGLWWVSQSTRRARVSALIGGALMLVSAIITAEQFGFHMEAVPALLALILFAFRESRQGMVLQTTATHAASGLPSLSQLLLAKGSQPAAIVSVKVERYAYLTQKMTREQERDFALAIASRINIIVPTCEVHQGDNGLFVFVATQDSGCVVDDIVLQLEALFTFSVGQDMPDDIGITVGVDDDASASLSMRTGRAVDRSERLTWSRIPRLRVVD